MQHDLINTWVKNGAPLGDPKDLPEPPKFVEGWQIGQPDVVIAMSETPYSVPATGVIPYQYFVVDPGFKEDKWIEAAECRIGNRAVVHHIIVGIKDGDDAASHVTQIRNAWITAAAPGSLPLVLPDGFAKLIPAGSKLVFQMHYTPNGTAQTDISSVGFKFADPETVRKAVGTTEVINRDFIQGKIKIPAGAENHEIKALYRFRNDSLMLSMFPHMHLRGKSFRYTASYPNGDSEILLDIPNYDFNWQNGYHFPEPKKIPAGTVLECVAHYDNSEKNFANPKPEKAVYWGDQTWEEMMIGYFDMALADQDLTKSGFNPRTQGLLERIEAGDEVVNDKIRESIKVSLKNKSSMARFGSALHASFPNIDRVCWTTIDNKTLNVARAVQVEFFRKKCGVEGESMAASGTKLAEIQKSGKPTAIADTRDVETPDMRLMSAAAKSSFHIPIEVNGKSGTVNFWSSEIEAFPKPVQDLLVQLVHDSLSSKTK